LLPRAFNEVICVVFGSGLISSLACYWIGSLLPSFPAGVYSLCLYRLAKLLCSDAQTFGYLLIVLRILMHTGRPSYLNIHPNYSCLCIPYLNVIPLAFIQPMVRA